MLPGAACTFGLSTSPYPRTQTLYLTHGRSGIANRPCSSVTTILVYFVGSSVVSAITHTPASGPFRPAAMPTVSSPSVVGDGRIPELCVWHPAATAIAAAMEIFLRLMALLFCRRIVLQAARARFRLGSEPRWGQSPESEKPKASLRFR